MTYISASEDQQLENSLKDLQRVITNTYNAVKFNAFFCVKEKMEAEGKER